MHKRHESRWFRWVRNWLHRHRDDFFSYLEFDGAYDMSGATLNLTVGETGHKVVVTNLNLDGSTAVGVSVSYSSDNPSACDVAGDGTLVANGAGVANITETSTRGAFTHSDVGVVTVTDENAGDFTTALTFS